MNMKYLLRTISFVFVFDIFGCISSSGNIFEFPIKFRKDLMEVVTCASVFNPKYRCYIAQHTILPSTSPKVSLRCTGMFYVEINAVGDGSKPRDVQKLFNVPRLRSCTKNDCLSFKDLENACLKVIEPTTASSVDTDRPDGTSGGHTLDVTMILVVVACVIFGCAVLGIIIWWCLCKSICIKKDVPNKENEQENVPLGVSHDTIVCYQEIVVETGESKVEDNVPSISVEEADTSDDSLNEENSEVEHEGDVHMSYDGQPADPPIKEVRDSVSYEVEIR